MGFQMKKASFLKRQIYRSLLVELKNNVDIIKKSQAKTDRLLDLFCTYLANYTEIKSVNEIDQYCIENYLKYLSNNHKRLAINLKDIKQSMQLLEESLELKIDQSLVDFSLSNTTLWNKL